MYPIIFDNSPLPLSSYYLLIGMALAVGYVYGKRVNETLPYRKMPFGIFYGGVLLFSWLGAKMFFLIFSPEKEVTLSLVDAAFWSGGGFVFYGGLLGGLFFMSIHEFSFKSTPFYEKASFLPVLTLCHAIGRIGCLLGGCCYGKRCLAGCLAGLSRHPVQAYEAIFLLILTLILRSMAEDGKRMVVTYLYSYGLWRFAIEFLRGDEIRGLYYGFSTSQYISLLLLGLGGVLHCHALRKVKT